MATPESLKRSGHILNLIEKWKLPVSHLKLIVAEITKRINDSESGADDDAFDA